MLVEYVLLPKRAPWLQNFQTEILQFPHGRHDDQVDSLSQYTPMTVGIYGKWGRGKTSVMRLLTRTG